MRPTFTFVILLLLGSVHALSQTNSTKNTPVSKPASKQVKSKLVKVKNAVDAQFQYFIIKANDNTYGYRIYVDGNLYIEQTTIPATSGNSGFADTIAAGKCAKLVIKKIQQGEMPPTLTTADLKKNNLIN